MAGSTLSLLLSAVSPLATVLFPMLGIDAATTTSILTALTTLINLIGI